MPVRRLARALRARANLTRTEPDEGFDPTFYRANNPDLRGLSDEALARHYRAHGRAEGRYGSEAQASAALGARAGAPPPEFDPCEYRLCNPDLRRTIRTSWQATEHYLRYGRAEKRKTFALDTTIYGELYFPGQKLSRAQLREDYEHVGRAAGRIASAAALSRSKGLPGCGFWITAIRPREFAQLNWTWASPAVTRADVVDAMLREGFDRLAPIAFGQVFEPAYYRDAHPEYATGTDAALYRRWLLEGHEWGAPGSVRGHLDSLGLPLDSFPAGFDWRAHACRHKLPLNRWAALDHLLEESALDSDDIAVTSEAAAPFLAALGQAFAGKDDRLSVGLIDRGTHHRPNLARSAAKPRRLLLPTGALVGGPRGLRPGRGRCGGQRLDLPQRRQRSAGSRAAGRRADPAGFGKGPGRRRPALPHRRPASG
jgi:hypothetical protein